MNNIYLIGYRTCGKSTVAKHLSGFTGYNVVSIDNEIEKEIGDIKAFVKQHDWSEFRKIESEKLMHASKLRNTIVDCGGGIIEKKDNIAIMNNSGICIWIKVDIKIIKKRLSSDTTRPSLSSQSVVDEVDVIYAKRIPLYEKAANVIIEASNKNAQDIAQEIVKVIS